MSYRIAVASKDGKVVTDHFGHCRKFIIIEANKESYEFIEQRIVNPPCIGGEHSAKGIEEVLDILKDCMYILVNQIGGGAERIVKNHNFEIVIYRGYITEALDQIISSNNQEERQGIRDGKKS